MRIEMKKVITSALATILMLSFAVGAKASSKRTGTIGDARCYQIGQPTISLETDGSCYYQIDQLMSNTWQTEVAVNPTDTAAGSQTPAFKTQPPETVTLNPDWSLPPSAYYSGVDSAPAVYAGRQQPAPPSKGTGAFCNPE